MKSTAGFVVCLIGGILNLILALLAGAFTLMLAIVIFGLASLTEGSMGNFSVIFLIVSAIGSLWLLISGILIIIFSTKINRDEEVRTGSVSCLVFGILSLNLLVIIGSAVGLNKSKINVDNQKKIEAAAENYFASLNIKT